MIAKSDEGAICIYVVNVELGRHQWALDGFKNLPPRRLGLGSVCMCVYRFGGRARSSNWLFDHPPLAVPLLTCRHFAASSEFGYDDFPEGTSDWILRLSWFVIGRSTIRERVNRG
jgi:hypothetical protein